MKWKFWRQPKVVHNFKLTQEDAVLAAAQRHQLVITARVYRASTDRWENLGVIARKHITRRKGE